MSRPRRPGGNAPSPALRLAGLLLCLALCACAGHIRSVPLDMADAAALTARFAALDSAEAPFRASLTARAGRVAGDTSDTRRVTGLLWGNTLDGPIRLDVQAGVGATVLRARADARGFAAFAPGENALYLLPATDAQAARRQQIQIMGLTLPFSLPELAALAQGHFGALFTLPEHAPVLAAGNGGGRLALTDGPRQGELTLTATGAPTRFADARTDWVLEFGYGPDSTRPNRISARHPDGSMTLILIRDLARPAAPFAPKQLALALPAGYRVLRLDDNDTARRPRRADLNQKE